MDFTKNKKMDTALRGFELRYRRLFESAQDGILILDAETGMIVDVNPFLINLLGYTYEQFCGKRLWEIGLFADIIANEEAFAEVQQKQCLRYDDLSLQTRDGRRIAVEFYCTAYEVDHGKIIQCTIRDITARQREEENLRRFATVVRDSNDAITIQDFAGNITAWNRGAELMYGYSEAEALMTNIDRLTAPGKVTEQQDFIRRLIAGEAITSFETQRITYDGRILDVWMTVTKLLDNAGTPIGLASTERDITMRKMEEENLRVRALELKRSNSELTRFLYITSHDLKSPLVTVRTFLGYLEKDLANGDAGRIEKDMDFMRIATDKMVPLLDDLLEMARVGRVVGPQVPVTFRTLVDDALGAVAGRIKQRGVTVNVDETEMTLYCDRVRMMEIWQNLLDNACKFLGDQPAPCIYIGVETREAETVFYVRDNGSGIDPRHQEKVFGLFEKLDTQVEGTGIGLTLVQRIVELYKGRIWLESAGKGQGTCFYFTLPAAINEQNQGETS